MTGFPFSVAPHGEGGIGGAAAAAVENMTPTAKEKAKPRGKVFMAAPGQERASRREEVSGRARDFSVGPETGPLKTCLLGSLQHPAPDRLALFLRDRRHVTERHRLRLHHAHQDAVGVSAN